MELLAKLGKTVTPEKAGAGMTKGTFARGSNENAFVQQLRQVYGSQEGTRIRDPFHGGYHRRTLAPGNTLLPGALHRLWGSALMSREPSQEPD